MDNKGLIKEAMEAKKMAYAPYSHFRVGAALLTKSGKVYRGCNIENAAFTPTNCAERTAFFKALSEGEKEFQAIAINGDADDYLFPCGVCRQVMVEFCDLKTFEVIVAINEKDYKVFTLEQLMPGVFNAEEMAKGQRLQNVYNFLIEMD